MPKLKRSIGFLGAGHMAAAMARILARSPQFNGDLLFFDIDRERADRLAGETMGTACPDAQGLAAADWIILAVKPQHMKEALSPLTPVCREKFILSIAAGIPIRFFESAFDNSNQIARCMPNTPMQVGAGACAVAFSTAVSADNQTDALRLFSLMGAAVALEEKLLDAVTGLSGSGPAYIFYIIRAMVDGGIQAGLPRDAALTLAAATVIGAGKMVQQGGDPEALQKAVTSPGGTTMEGISVLEKTGVSDALQKAVTAATEKSKILGRRYE